MRGSDIPVQLTLAPKPVLRDLVLLVEFNSNDA